MNNVKDQKPFTATGFVADFDSTDEDRWYISFDSSSILNFSILFSVGFSKNYLVMKR